MKAKDLKPGHKFKTLGYDVNATFTVAGRPELVGVHVKMGVVGRDDAVWLRADEEVELLG